jgi:hypothetical protein
MKNSQANDIVPQGTPANVVNVHSNTPRLRIYRRLSRNRSRIRAAYRKPNRPIRFTSDHIKAMDTMTWQRVKSAHKHITATGCVEIRRITEQAMQTPGFTYIVALRVRID